MSLSIFAIYYYVFEMYKIHQNATSLKTDVNCKSITYILEGKTYDIPSISCSASFRDGILALTLANLTVGEDQEIMLNLHGGQYTSTGTMVVLSSYNHKNGNSFEEPYKVTPVEQNISPVGVELTVTIPFINIACI
jgi:alpha-N-arabinofuranosidase